MPTVPIYGNRQVGSAALPGARKQAGETALSEGAGVDQAQAQQYGELAQLGATGAHLATAEYAEQAQKERDRADQIAVLNASNRLSSWSNDRLFNPDTGALNVKGKDAMGLPEQVIGEFTDTANEIAQGLSTDRQREAFLRVRLDAQQNLDLTTRRHTLNEINTYEAGELKASIENSTNAAVQNATDPRRVGDELGKITDTIKTHGKNLGMGEEQIQASIDDARTKVHVGVIDRLLSLDKDKAARIYFEETQSQIDGDAQARIQKALDEAGTRREGQQQSDAILAAGGTLSEQRDKARAIDDPKVRDEVMSRIEHEAAVKDKIQRDDEESTLIAAYNIVDKTKDVSAIPGNTWDKLDGGARSALRGYALNLARGVPVETDLPTYYNLIQLAGDDREKFATTNLLAFRAKLGEAEFKQLAGLQLSIRAGDDRKADTELAGFLTHKDIADNKLSQFGIETSAAKQTPEEKNAVATLMGMVDKRVGALQSLTGKKATNDDIARIFDELLSQSRTVPGSWWNIWPGGAPFFDSTKRVIDMQVGDIPANERSQIEQALRKAGRPVSDATVLNLYIETQARKRQ